MSKIPPAVEDVTLPLIGTLRDWIDRQEVVKPTIE